MKLYQGIEDLLHYAKYNAMITEDEMVYSRNQLLDLFHEDNWEDPGDTIFNHLEDPKQDIEDGFLLEAILNVLLDEANRRGLVGDNTVTERDLFDAKIMNCVMPRPGELREVFQTFYRYDPKEATDWFYNFSKNTDYIRRYRIKKDLRWETETPYGLMQISVNLSKPEKDPKAIAAAKQSTQKAYPQCQLCLDNVGYAGRLDHPGRANHRVMPIDLAGEPWYFQYSPYVYYNEHCIVFAKKHEPMEINAHTFDRLLDFVWKFPHYFIGSNADLPIVGGSILTHNHFQGGSHTFPMDQAPLEVRFTVPGYSGVQCGVVHWPLSVIRLQGYSVPPMVALAEHILETWKNYSDPEVGILAETNGERHNTITPIARKRGEVLELDLVLRNNRTTEEHPMGLFHPHADKHHIKKENIGLIEVMGLAVLPARLKGEIMKLSDALVYGKDCRQDAELEKHADWADEIRAKYKKITPENVNGILCDEIGNVFVGVLEDAGVFKCTQEGRMAFQRFLESMDVR